jgi:Xaa-Pro aminopeptidase
MFAAAIYAARRAQLRRNLPDKGLVLLPANEPVPFNYAANQYHFRQDSTFLYYFGLDLPGFTAVLDLESGASTLFGPEPTMDDVIWEGPLPSLPELGAQVGVVDTRASENFPAFLNDARSKGRAVHFLPPYRADIAQRLAAWLDVSPEALPKKTSVPLVEAVIAQRLIKAPEEIAQMEQALAITRDMYLHAMRSTRAGRYEYELAGAAEGIAKGGHGGLAYSIILSVNGHILHNHAHHNKMRKGQLVTCDMGAENRLHYAADITRTWPVDTRFTAQQKEIYEIVLAAHEKAAQLSRPGVLYRDCHLAAWAVIAEGLQQAGLLKQGDPAEMAALGVPGLFMPHGLGHQIGLDVHDLENLGEDRIGYRAGLQRSPLLGLKSLRYARELEAGQVLTNEPGIYFIPPLIDRWQSEGKFKDFINYSKLKPYRNFGGIRIEDNYLITEEGNRMLGKKIPKTVKEVEAVRRG